MENAQKNVSNMNMRKNLNEYNLYVFDLDGTLYFQKPLRLKMLLFLIISAIKKPSNIKKILVVSSYRKMREAWDKDAVKDLEYQQYTVIAKEKKCTIEYVQQAVQEFMFDAPLPFLRKYKDERLAEFIKELRSKGKQVVVYSDYPVERKLQALGIEVDSTYCAFDAEIGSLKPRPDGLLHVLSAEKVEAEDAIMIGDRYVKDGQAAISTGVDYLILSSKKDKRYAMLSEILNN